MDERNPTSRPANGASNQETSIANSGEEWCVPIFHEVCLLDSIFPTMHNLCDCMDKSNIFDNFAYRFSSITYNVSDNGSRKRLQESLISAAKQSSGLDLVVSSGPKRPELRTGARRSFSLQCACSIPYVYRPPRLSNGNNSYSANPNECSSAEQQGENTKKVIHRRRRTVTKRVVNKSDGMCKFQLPVYVDHISFFVLSRVGYNRHSAHPKPGQETKSTTTLQPVEPKNKQSRRERIAAKSIEHNVTRVEEEEQEMFQGDSGDSFDHSTKDREVREVISSDHGDANDDFSENDMDHDFSTNDDDICDAIVQLDPYKEFNPLFQRIVDMAQANNNANERVLKAKSMLENVIAELEKDILAEGRVLKDSSSRQQATKSSKRRCCVP